jgi:hypothetical protein
VQRANACVCHPLRYAILNITKGVSDESAGSGTGTRGKPATAAAARCPLAEEACSHATQDCRLGDEESRAAPAPASGACTNSGVSRNLHVGQVCGFVDEYVLREELKIPLPQQDGQA